MQHYPNLLDLRIPLCVCVWNIPRDLWIYFGKPAVRFLVHSTGKLVELYLQVNNMIPL